MFGFIVKKHVKPENSISDWLSNWSKKLVDYANKAKPAEPWLDKDAYDIIKNLDMPFNTVFKSDFWN